MRIKGFKKGRTAKKSTGSKVNPQKRPKGKNTIIHILRAGNRISATRGKQR
jgi:hypothetical protein|tara:strand:- start:1850 stop:2002 length:153 start_codon:yes stop_codon:yes gene_type:complete